MRERYTLQEETLGASQAGGVAHRLDFWNGRLARVAGEALMYGVTFAILPVAVGAVTALTGHGDFVQTAGAVLVPELFGLVIHTFGTICGNAVA